MTQPELEATYDKKYEYENEFQEHTVCFDDAEAYIKWIETFHAKCGDHHIYRGQRCHSWTLLPAYLRLQTYDLNKYRQMLMDYFQIGLFNGLDLPLDKPYESLIDPVRQRLVFTDRGPVDNPHMQAPSALVAHAQHNGLPTELLDATRDPMVASFFAVWKNTGENREPLNESVIWAFNENELYARTNLRVWTYPVSASFTPNQKSVFLWDSGGSGRSDYSKPFEEELLHAKDIEGAFRRIVLCKKAIIGLQDILEKRGVTYTSMFPDWRDIACSIKKKCGFSEADHKS
ncbi:MAG: FRG domain-containing protein [Chloroflexota bacterium]|nr:FRG domain-containing protein [Chloroflexota bacterium]MDE2947675.1 FRG domain-containing protein [Chloroflexota bacterium]